MGFRHRSSARSSCRPASARQGFGRPVRLVTGLCTISILSCGSPAGPDAPEHVNCTVFDEHRSSAYVLPFLPGKEYRVSRTFAHYTAGNGGVGLYAVDFVMPIGTKVTASRAGVVVAVEERYWDSDHTDLHENWVMIRHDDGTVARYIHLARNGALVAVGDHVARGRVIGLSGNSGASSRPHLHFDVQACGPNLPPDYNRLPCGRTQPLSFSNTAAHHCGLEAGRTYQAAPFVSQSANPWGREEA
jgi:murein DD-endopeptidase MepM/ murein hydrolase activator NlpD